MSVIAGALAYAEAQRTRRSPIGPDALARLSAEVAVLGLARQHIAKHRTRAAMLAEIDDLMQCRREEFSAMSSACCAAVLDRESPCATP